jgi:protein SCO1/2
MISIASLPSSNHSWRTLEAACLCVGLLLTSIACSKKPAGKRYELQGRVVAVDSGSREITVAHQNIPGLMPGMTMPFPVARNQDWIFGKIGPGDHIHATLVMTDHAELQDVSFTQGSDTGNDGTTNLRVPEIGDDIPDFTLVNQFGKTIHLDQFRGKPLLLTFIYTRCPVPDFCLLMSNNFSAVLRELQKNPAVFAKAQLLSISIDPDYDTPGVLRTYGKRYVGDVDSGFQHWQFASGSREEVRRAADFFGLSYNEKQRQIVHTLQTVVIGGDGKIARVYAGNQWKPAEVAAEYEAAASGR